MPEDHENPAAYRVQELSQSMDLKRRRIVAIPDEISRLDAKKAALNTELATATADGKKAAADFRTLVAVPTGTIDHTAVLGKAATWVGGNAARQRRVVNDINSDITFLEGLS